MSNPVLPSIVGLGEVLWDLLPSGKVLGGAPFNFTFHCHQFGHAAVMVSRVGRDELGHEIRAAMRDLGLDDSFVQDDSEHPTGTVGVELNSAGQPSFTIHPGAWDHLAWDDRLEAVLGQAQAVCFGTLIQRSAGARAAVRRALRAARNALVVYDVNLRQDFYSREVLEESLRASRWVKLNDGELAVLRAMFDFSGTNQSAIVADLRKRFGTELVALTRGEQGCLVQTADEEVLASGVRVQVVDTIGAGDAFTAGLVCAMLEGRSVADAARFANGLAAAVAARAGGTPRLERAEIEGGPPERK
jgi:fructokinase